MCRAFSCLVTRGDKVYWKVGIDSHDKIRELFDDCNLQDDKQPPLNAFARIEIVPPEGNYLNTDFNSWKYQIDERIRPDFLSDKHEDLCQHAFRDWVKVVYTFNAEEAKNPIHPFKITPPKKITKKHLALLRTWASVRASVWDSVRDSVRDSVWASVGASVRDSVGDSVWDSVWASVRDSVGDSVWDSVWASVRDSVRDSVWASVGASVWAYCGSLFPLKEWQYIDYANPFQSCVDLWKMGLVPSFDGRIWRLHGGGKAEILWEGTFMKGGE